VLSDDIAIELGDDLARGHNLWNWHVVEDFLGGGYNSSNTN
jgi:hypothetical protein